MGTTAHQLPLCFSAGLVELILENDFEAEQVCDCDETAQRQIRGISFKSRQAALAHMKLGGELLLRNVARFAPSSNDLAHLVRGIDE